MFTEYGYNWRNWFLRIAWLLTLVLIISCSASAQTASLTGTLYKPDNKPVDDAEIVLINNANGIPRTAETDERGIFVFTQMPPAVYTLAANVPPFRSIKVENINLTVDSAWTLDLKLESGKAAQPVLLVGDRVLHRANAALGNAIDQAQISDLPLESRDLVPLLTLQPAVTQSGFAAGSRADESNVTLDGVNANRLVGFPLEPAFHVTPDSIRQLKVTTHNPDASQGGSSGPQVSLVTKSGTNEPHGSLYYYNRNTATAANNFFNNRALDSNGNPDPLPRPDVSRHIYGLSFGAPLSKDHTFFFYNYEGRKDHRQETLVRETPLAHLGTGAVRYENLAGNLVTLTPQQISSLYSSGVNSYATAVLAEAAEKYPANDTTAGDGINTGGYRFNANLPADYNTNVLRIDHSRSEHQQFSLRFNYQSDKSWSAPRFPDTPSPEVWSHPLGVMIQHAWSIGTSRLNTFRYGLTRQSVSAYGDSEQNAASFNSVFQPYNFSRTMTRVTPVHSFTDDFSWIRGRHHFQFGTNIRFVTNRTSSLDGTFDSAGIDPYSYATGGSSLVNPISDVAPGSVSTLESGVAAVLGQWSSYKANYSFSPGGVLLEVGEPKVREFETREYELYAQDSWRIRPTLTVTGGVRWSLDDPLTETNGYQAMTTTSLGGFFEERQASSQKGEALSDLIEVDLGGPSNHKRDWYAREWKNFSPRGALAWNPSFTNGILSALFGERKSVIRAGAGMAYDHLGSALAVLPDLSDSLAFSSSWTLARNTFNAADKPGPLFNAFNPDVRSFPEVVVPASITFPYTYPSNSVMRSASTLDDTLRSPVNYTWSLSWGRDVGQGLYVEAAYLGGAARHLLAKRDVLMPNDIVDPKSGMDWYTAAAILSKERLKGTPVSAIPEIPFFSNLFPGYATPSLTPTQRVYRLIASPEAGGHNDPDWTYIQAILNSASIIPNVFYHPQWASLVAWSSVAESDYHALALSVRERFRQSLTLDVNYTFSKSIDNSSAFEAAGQLSSSALIVNPLQPGDMRSVSDFDQTHIVNANWIWDVPVGRGRALLGGMRGWQEAALGGWKISGLLRWNSGLPTGRTVDLSGFATNWQVRSADVRIRDISASPTKGGANPNLFTDPVYAYQSFRTPLPGETGDRNIWRVEPYLALDLAVHKQFVMPYSENQRVVLRWEVFNATNTQRLGSSPFLDMGLDPSRGEPGADFGKITAIQGTPRVMQFAVRYTF